VRNTDCRVAAVHREPRVRHFAIRGPADAVRDASVPLLPEEEEDQFQVEIAAREALANAVIHGNGEDARKRVYIVCRCTVEGELALSVADEGSGFDVCAIADPTAPENLLLTDGRGIRLRRALMDDVRFEKGGTVVHLIKRLRA
jgi:anti-sigma regulatory factor (Ser/Thr protein kinase)